MMVGKVGNTFEIDLEEQYSGMVRLWGISFGKHRACAKTRKVSSTMTYLWYQTKALEKTMFHCAAISEVNGFA